MPNKQINCNLLAGTAVFLAAVLFYLLPVHVPHRIAIPLLLLAVFSFTGRLPWQICLAFIFSFIGDLAGSFTGAYGDAAFFTQIGGFALAHLCLIIMFLSYGLKQKRAYAEEEKKQSKNKKQQSVRKQGFYMAAVLAITLIIMNMAGNTILPYVGSGMMLYMVGLYMGVICVMFWSALMTGRWVWGLAATLFLASDYILAFTLFIEPFSGDKYAIMLPYYTAQLLFFIETSRIKS